MSGSVLIQKRQTSLKQQVFKNASPVINRVSTSRDTLCVNIAQEEKRGMKLIKKVLKVPLMCINMRQVQ